MNDRDCNCPHSCPQFSCRLASVMCKSDPISQMMVLLLHIKNIYREIYNIKNVCIVMQHNQEQFSWCNCMIFMNLVSTVLQKYFLRKVEVLFTMVFFFNIVFIIFSDISQKTIIILCKIHEIIPQGLLPATRCYVGFVFCVPFCCLDMMRVYF